MMLEFSGCRSQNCWNLKDRKLLVWLIAFSSFFFLNIFFSFSLLCVPCLCGLWLYPGEMLKLNPSYKAPPDYKPLLKEARVPIPVSHIKIVAF